MDVKVDSRVFNEIYLKNALRNDRRIQIYFGGSSSGKSYFIIGQRTVLDILAGQRNYLICRNTGSTISHSVWNELVSAINTMNLEAIFHFNKTDRVITCLLNQKQVIFKGLDDVQKIKSIKPLDGVITDIVIEEATELVSMSIIKDLIKRQRGKCNVKKRLTLIFNPILQSHFIYKEFFLGFWADNGDQFQANDEISIMKTTYKDNLRFLTEEDCDDLENESDLYYYNVYTLGNWGVLGNLIFKNWTTEHIDPALRASFDNHRHGGDWGFAKDPFAYIKLHYDKTRKKIYLLNEIYAPELTNEEAADLIRPYCGTDRVVFDSSEPKSIFEFTNKYHINAVSAKKGAGSVIQGIRWLQSQEIIIDSPLQNAINEFSMYKFKENRQGEVLPLPVDKNNHIIDSTRYATEGDIVESPGPVSIRM